MVVALTTRKDTGEDVIVVGFSKSNIEHLQKGRAVHLNLQKVGVSTPVFVIYGETEDDILAQMNNNITEKTQIIDERSKP